ncbi:MULTISPECIES: hypothetical protein [Streptomyces]|uniref:hypothetical protein n=1 Tax=Streptomyces TaxID=1883 RepID=UPI001180D8DE|nr:hypothetical protein [Streptomyces kasugaensis]
MKKSPTLLALAYAAALALLTACGPDTTPGATGGSKPQKNAGSDAKPNGIQTRSTAEIYEAGTAANAHSGSFRERSKSTMSESDVRVSATECVGKVHLIKDEVGEIGGSFEIIQKNSDVWAKFDKGFSDWAKSEFAFPAEKWLHGTTSNRLMELVISHCDRKKITTPDKGDSYMKKGGAAVIDGVPVIQVTSQGSGGTATYSIATTGKPYLLKRDVDRAEQSTISYSEFGKLIDSKAPSGEIAEAPSR